jgi:uncharacterized repeat protein (TIGR03803 family)
LKPHVPFAGLIGVNGTLYGTTTAASSSNSGTVFSLGTTSGAETVLYVLLQSAELCRRCKPQRRCAR